MRLQPFGRMLPVHCCCEPGKRLGWVPVRPELLRRPGFVSYAIGPRRQVQVFPDEQVIPVRELHTTVERLRRVVREATPYVCEKGQAHYTVPVVIEHYAVNSKHEPIETWRKVAGFVEERAR